MTWAEENFSEIIVYKIPLNVDFRGITAREGVLIKGPEGWAEFAPFLEYDDHEAGWWLRAAIEQATQAWPVARRQSIPVNCIIPEVTPAQAAQRVIESGCATAKVKVAGSLNSLAADCARVAAVRAALGAQGQIRIDANAGWDVHSAIRCINELEQAALGLQYVEQPCATFEELCELREKVTVKLAVDELIRKVVWPANPRLKECADLAILKSTPLGGVRRSLDIAHKIGLPVVVSSALETSIGLQSQIALAAALPELSFACGLDTLSIFDGDLATGVVVSQGWLNIPKKKLNPDPEMLIQFQETDPLKVIWWKQRLNRVGELIAQE